MISPADIADRYNALAKAQGWRSTCCAALEFRNHALSDLLAIWRRIAPPSGVPRRKELTPRMLRMHLADIALYERSRDQEGRERYRMRVIGARYSSVLGDFGTGYFDETVPPKYLKRWHAAPNAVIEARAPLRFVSRTETVDKPFLTGEYMMAPLIGDGGEVDTVISGAAFGPTITPQRR
jgi:hypothetical protein